MNRRFSILMFLLFALFAGQAGGFSFAERDTHACSMMACPFCSAVAATFTENIETNQIVVFAKLVKPAPEIEDDDIFLPKAELEIVTIQKGQEFVEVGMRFKALLVGKYDVGQLFLVMGVDPPDTVWSTPLRANQNLVDYIGKLEKLPREGAERLAFFLPYLEHEDDVLTYDAYDEFARCKYEDLIELKDRIDRKTLMEWIANPDVPINRRRLYFTMLGVCGTAEDAQELERLIRSGDREQQAGLDALVASYLTLVGNPGMDVIDECLLLPEESDDLQLLSVKAALTFHAMDVKVLSKDRVIKSLRMFLERPAIADAVLPDLSRLEDWGAADRVARLFDDLDTNFQKVMVVQFLQACPTPEAKKHLSEIEERAPEVIKRAKFLSDFDFGDSEEESPSKPKLPSEPDSAVLGSLNQDSEQVTALKTPVFSDIAGSGPSTQADPPADAEETQTFTVLAGEPSPVENVEIPVGRPVTSTDDPSPPVTVRDESDAPAAGSFRLGVVVLTLPMIVSIGVFLLIWSVISGWFERLIF